GRDTYDEPLDPTREERDRRVAARVERVETVRNHLGQRRLRRAPRLQRSRHDRRDLPRAAQQVGDYVLGHHQLHLVRHAGNRVDDPGLVVADHAVLVGVDARRRGLLADPGAVAVDDLAQQELGADRENFASHPGKLAPRPGARLPCVTEPIEYAWRAPVTDDEMVALVRSHGGRAVPGWWDRIRQHSLGWVTARARDGTVVGFVNVAWDGGDHAFLLDPKTRGAFQRKGIGTRLVELAARHAKGA